MRGAKQFQSLFPEMEVQDESVKVRGRDAQLLARRNERLCHRLWYYRNFTTHHHDLVLELLELEFEISISTITQVTQLDACEVVLQQLRKLNPDLGYFREKYPLMSWERAQPLSRKGRM
jgi:hypothetical protein